MKEKTPFDFSLDRQRTAKQSEWRKGVR